MPLPRVQAMLFDVFGTVVDWHGTIVAEGEASGIAIDWSAFANRWRSGYRPALDRVRSGELPWTSLDDLHRAILDRLAAEFGLTMTAPELDHLNRVWHRLRPWPDAVPGLTQLKERFIIAPLSNGGVALLTNMAKLVGLPWDLILSAELARHYKPDPEAYLTACSLLDLAPEQIMMAAAHRADLDAARACGLRTAFIHRPHEYGHSGQADTARPGDYDVIVHDILELSRVI